MSSTESDLFLAASIGGGSSWAAQALQRGADVNACDRWHLTPLYYASLAGNVEAARTLLEAGAIFDDTTYHAALSRAMRKLLRSYGRPRPPPLAPLPAALRSAFHACPANRAGADAVPCPAPPDITLYVQGRPIEAHRVMLAARSPYFRKKLTTEWRNRKEVTLSESHHPSFQVMHDLVGFFYADRAQVSAHDIHDWATICRACECHGILELVNTSIDRNRYGDPQTRQRHFLLEGPSMDRDRLPSALRRILQDCLANSRAEDLRNNESVETCDDLADVCIKVGDRIFRCHQLFLAMRSEYFKTRLSRRADFLELHCSGGDQLPLLEEHDVRAEAFEKMLEYVYTDELEHLDLGDDPLIQAEELFDVASRYLMCGFKRVLASFLLPLVDLEYISAAQLCRWLVLSHMYDVAKLREHCLDTIACNFEEFAEAREFRALLRTLATPADGEGDLLNELRERWLAAGLDRTDENAAMFHERLKMLVLRAEQEANDDDTNV